MLFKASYFGSSSNSNDWGQAQPSVTATAEPVPNSVPTPANESQIQLPSRWQDRRRFPPVYTTEEASTTAYYPVNRNLSHDPREETMEDRHYHPTPAVPSQYYPSHRFCRWQNSHKKNYKLNQAEKMAELISNRNFSQVSNSSDSTTAYSLLLGGATFLALTGLVSATGLQPRLSGLMGRKMAHLTLTAAAGVAAGSVSVRYQVQHKTLNDLKIVGSYMTPSEPSASADALCQHPIVVQALMNRQREQQIQSQFQQQQQLQNTGYENQHFPPHDYYHRYGPRRGTKRQILNELDHVLDHFEERQALLLQAAEPSSRAEATN